MQAISFCQHHKTIFFWKKTRWKKIARYLRNWRRWRYTGDFSWRRYVFCHAQVRGWVMSHMHELCHLWMSIVKLMNASCHMWICSLGDALYSAVLRFAGESTHTRMSHVIYGWVIYSHAHESCHLWMSHFKRVHASCHMWICSLGDALYSVMIRFVGDSCHACMSQVIYEWVVSNIWMRHVTYDYDLFAILYILQCSGSWASHGTYQWVMSYMNASCHMCMSHVTYQYVTSHMSESRHIWMSRVSYEWVTSHMNQSRHAWMSHITRAWIMSQWFTSHMNESWHIWTSHVTYEWVTLHMNESRHIWISHVTYECRLILANLKYHLASHLDMGWLRLVGSLELQVSFAEYRLFYRALLQKRHIILRSLLIEATP